MQWVIIYLGGACALITASCARTGGAAQHRILRAGATAGLLIGGLLMLAGGELLEVLVIAVLTVALMVIGTCIQKENRTPLIWLLAPVMLCAAAILLLATQGLRPDRTTPEVLFQGGALRAEQLAILDDARTELMLLDQRDFPRLLAEARETSNWSRLQDLERIRETFPKLRERLRELTDQVQAGTAGEQTTVMAQELAKRIYLIGDFPRPAGVAR